MTIREARPDDLEVDLHTLARALFSSLKFLLPIAAIAAAGTYLALTRVAPEYTAEAKILIEASESQLTRPAGADTAETQALLDEQGVTSQVELVRSREVAHAVADQLQLGKLPEFDPLLNGPGFFTRILNSIGLARDPNGPAEERVMDSFFKKLSVYPVDKSRVIVIDFTAHDPDLAARITNSIAEQYLILQQSAQRDSNQGASAWLATQIADLQLKVRDAEAKVESFRSSSDLFGTPGDNGATLAQQQLTDLNSELGRVRATRADAEAKASQIRAGLQNGAALTSLDVLKSGLIERLSEQEVGLRAQIAQLAATLLPSHPRMRELNAQLVDLDAQIRVEAGKLLTGLENDAKLAQAREEEILRNLTQQKVTTTKSNDAAVQLRALDREATAQRDLLETYLRQYREALSRQNGNYLPANARIVSRAAAPVDPSFPKKGALSAAAAVATLILGICFVLIRELAMQKPVHALRFVGALPTLPGESGEERWADDRGVRRMMPRDRLEGPPLSGAAERSLSAIVRRIVELEARRTLVAMSDEAPDGGRPLAAVALARALAKTGARTVLVDFRTDGADHQAMGETASDLPGFSDLFAGKVSFGQVIFRDRNSSAHFVPAGMGRPPGGWQSDPRFGTLMDALEHTYDHLIIDADEATLAQLAPSAGAVVLVSDAGTSDARTVNAYERLTSLAAGEVMLLVSEPENALAETAAA